MLDPLSPLILPAERHLDFSDQDWSKEIDQHGERQVLTDALLLFGTMLHGYTRSSLSNWILSNPYPQRSTPPKVRQDWIPVPC
jgi:hypothetical protein